MFASMLTLALGARAPVRYSSTGIPVLVSDQGNLEIRNHAVTMTIRGGFVEGESVTEVRNPALKPAHIEVRVPLQTGHRRTEVPEMTLRATWSGQLLSLTPVGSGDRDDDTWTVGTGYMPPRSTSALRTKFRQPVLQMTPGRINWRSFLYRFMPARDASTIGQINVAIKYDEREVFGKPEVPASWKWQVGPKGAFLRLKDYTPGGDYLVFGFYSPRFEG